MVRGSASLARSALFASSFAISASEATATAIISRPSSVVPIEKTFTRGVDLASSRMYSYTSLEYGSLPFGAGDVAEDRLRRRHGLRRRQIVDQRRGEEGFGRVFLDPLRVFLVDRLVRIASGLGVGEIGLGAACRISGAWPAARRPAQSAPRPPAGGGVAYPGHTCSSRKPHGPEIVPPWMKGYRIAIGAPAEAADDRLRGAGDARGRLT